jgi:hypothetical protein
MIRHASPHLTRRIPAFIARLTTVAHGTPPPNARHEQGPSISRALFSAR